MLAKLKSADLRARESERFLAIVLNGIGEGVVVIDRAFRITSANRAYCTQVGISFGDIVGRRCYEVSHRACRPCHENGGQECAVKRCFETGEHHRFVHNHQDSEGTTIHVETNAYPLKDPSGRVTAAVETVEDVTQRAEMERRLMHEKEHYQTEKKSLEAQLLHAQKMEAIGTLAGGVAHEFNNIITAITGFGSLLKNKIKDDPFRGYVAEILAASQRAEKLTRSLLTFGRKQKMVRVRIDLNEIVVRVEKLLALVIGEDIELSASTGGKELTVLADPAQIEQVLINLATNARDAMPSGGRFAIETDVATIDNEYVKRHGYGITGTYARISTSDSGTGMDEATRARIFDPFFTTKEAGKGSGLGLAIVYGIVKQHNGYINCFSEPGKGTTFIIYLPLLNEKAEDRGPAAQDPFPRGGETVLVVEDSALARTFLEAVLKEHGYTIITASDGEDAVEKFTAFADKIDLTILDIVMPKKSGTDVYEEIRRIKSDAKTLFMSAYSSDSARQREIINRGLNYIEKPVSPGVLLKKMRVLLDS